MPFSLDIVASSTGLVATGSTLWKRLNSRTLMFAPSVMAMTPTLLSWL